jgi:hypothetical protein
MRYFALALALLGSASIQGCKSEPGGEGDACKKKEDCAEGLSCVDNTCSKLASEPAPAPLTGYCQTVASLAGTWTFDTTVIGAEDLDPRGINGHYEMTVAVEDCTASIQLTKTGYDDVKFAEKKVQHSDAALAESKQITHAAEATVSLKGEPTHTMTFMIRDGQLFGFWQSTGHEWDRAGMWGFLRGVQKGQDLAKVEDFAAQPCEVACLTQCDTARRRADATLDEPALAACLTACSSGQAIAGCPGKPLPTELIVMLTGPVKTIEELCEKASAELIAENAAEVPATAVTCDRKPPVAGKPASRSLNKGALAGSFLAAELLQVSYFDVGFTGRIILALETEAGWFWTKPLMDISATGVAGVTSDTTSLVLRARDLLSAPGREVIAELGLQVNDSDLGVNEVAIDEQKYVVVCSASSSPMCMEMTTRWSSQRTLIDEKGDDPKKHPDLYDKHGELYLSFLPGDLLSISVPAGAREQDLQLSGIWSWPK